MTPSHFLSARRKIERANQHIKEAQSRINEFLAANFYPPFIDKDPKTGNLCGNFWEPSTQDLPLGTVIGDVVHNLRSALDHTIAEIVRTLGGNDMSSDVHFPAHETRNKLKKAIDGGLKKKIGAELCDFIVDTIKPYKTGNYAL